MTTFLFTNDPSTTPNKYTKDTWFTFNEAMPMRITKTLYYIFEHNAYIKFS